MITKLDPSSLAKGKGLDKKSLLYLGIVLAIAILVCVGSFYFLSQMPEIEVEPGGKKPAGKTIEEVIKELTAPDGEAEPLPEETIEGLTTPKSEEETSRVSEDLIKDLTVPE